MSLNCFDNPPSSVYISTRGLVSNTSGPLTRGFFYEACPPFRGRCRTLPVLHRLRHPRLQRRPPHHPVPRRKTHRRTCQWHPPRLGLRKPPDDRRYRLRLPLPAPLTQHQVERPLRFAKRIIPQVHEGHEVLIARDRKSVV